MTPRANPASYSRAPAFGPDAVSLRPSRPQNAPGATEPYAGPPYQVDGRWFVPAHEPDYNETGVASWYGPGFHGKETASGETFDQDAFTAAHPTLPIPSLVRVTNLSNGRSLIVRLNDRGPYKNDRIIDLSRGAAEKLGVTSTGTARVQVQYVGPAPAEPNSVPASETRIAAPAPVSFVAKAPLEAVRSEPLRPLPAATPNTDAPWPTHPREAPRQDPREETPSGLFLQVGAFADLGNAHRLVDKLSAFGPAKVTSVQTARGELYRVVLGPWRSPDARDEAQARLRAAGVKAMPAPVP
jgi:rare lipoprotein A